MGEICGLGPYAASALARNTITDVTYEQSVVGDQTCHRIASCNPHDSWRLRHAQSEKEQPGRQETAASDKKGEARGEEVERRREPAPGHREKVNF